LLLKRSSVSHDEQGAVYILAMFVIVILLAMAGLAVDAGNIYHARIQLQKSTDTGALAGIGSLFVNDNVPPAASALGGYIEARALELTKENLRAEGFDVDSTDITITPVYDPDTRTLTVTSEAKHDYLLMDLVPLEILGVNRAVGTNTIMASAAVRREAANIALVLDMSTSMECPSEGTCECKTPGRDPSADCAAEAAGMGTTQKFQELQNSVDLFLTYFDPEYDRISLTLFKKGANLKVSLFPSEFRGFNATQISDELRNVSPGGFTNPSAGLLEAYNDMVTSGVNGNEEATYILFSDGAPTAGRFLFSSPKPGLNIENPTGLGEYDYTSFAVHWTNTSTGATFIGPSMLGKTSQVTWDDTTSNIDPGAAPDCSNSISDSTTYGRGEAIPLQAKHDAVFSACLNDMKIHMPNAETVGFGETITDASSPGYSDSFQELYYNSVVNLTDFLRSRRSHVYTIGLGPQAPDDGSSDPYQDINDTLFRKDVFLTRVSNDLGLAKPLNDDPHPEFSYDGYQTYENINSRPVTREGRYYTATEATELEAVFANVAQKTLLRLVK